MENKMVDLSRQQRIADKQTRQLEIEQTSLEHKQRQYMSQSDRLVVDKKLIRAERAKFKINMSNATRRRAADKKVRIILSVFCVVFFDA
jgi:hypothetical protein